MTNQLPNGWQQTLLVDVIDSIVGGGTPSKAIPSYYTGNIPWMTVKDMNKHVLTDTIDHITEEAVNKSSSNIIPAGIPIIATRMSLGKIITARFDSAINQDLKAIFLNKNIDTKYFVFWYRSFGKNIEALGTGTTVQGIRLEVLKALPFPLCSIAEQKEIATLLDNLLAQVDTLKTRLDAISNILKRFRQSVLAAAVSGKLTEDDSVEFIKKEKTITTLQEVSSVIGGLTKNARRSELPIKKPYLRVANVYENEFRLDDVSEIGVEEKELQRILLKANDLLIVEGNGSLEHIGRAALWKGEISDCVHQNHLIKVRVDENNQNAKFLLFYLMSPQGKAEIISKATSGAGLYTLSISKVASIQVPVFSLEEQEEIVRRVEELFAFADQIEQRVKVAQQRVNHLTQAILAKAFRGELTAEWREQNPDLISGENSAAALLARIQAEQKLKQVLAKPTRRQPKSLELDTTDFKFDREEANQR